MLIYFTIVLNCIQEDFLKKWHVQVSINFLIIISLPSRSQFRPDILAGNLLDLRKTINQLPQHHCWQNASTGACGIHHYIPIHKQSSDDSMTSFYDYVGKFLHAIWVMFSKYTSTLQPTEPPTFTLFDSDSATYLS